MMTPDDIDKLVLATAHPQWRKVALIVATVGMSLSDESNGNYETVAARIVALVKAGKLEAQGDLSEWRHSEVRLPQK